MRKHILIVEDEPSIATLIQYNVEKENFTVHVATNGEEALQKFSNKQYAMIILDIMLPRMNGMEVCTTIREKNKDVPIIMLTAKTDEMSKIKGLEIGADDYITKPFSPRELIARMNVLFRRLHPKEQANGKVRIGDIEVDMQNYTVTLHDEPVHLTKKEFELIEYFIHYKDEVLSRDTLLKDVWHYDFAGDTRIVDVHVGHLREKLFHHNDKLPFIKTVRGVGYKLVTA